MQMCKTTQHTNTEFDVSEKDVGFVSLKKLFDKLFLFLQNIISGILIGYCMIG